MKIYFNSTLQKKPWETPAIKKECTRRFILLKSAIQIKESSNLDLNSKLGIGCKRVDEISASTSCLSSDPTSGEWCHLPLEIRAAVVSSQGIRREIADLHLQSYIIINISQVLYKLNWIFFLCVFWQIRPSGQYWKYLLLLRLGFFHTKLDFLYIVEFTLKSWFK